MSCITNNFTNNLFSSWKIINSTIKNNVFWEGGGGGLSSDTVSHCNLRRTKIWWLSLLQYSLHQYQALPLPHPLNKNWPTKCSPQTITWMWLRIILKVFHELHVWTVKICFSWQKNKRQKNTYYITHFQTLTVVYSTMEPPKISPVWRTHISKTLLSWWSLLRLSNTGLPSLESVNKSLAMSNTSCSCIGLFSLSLCSSKPLYFLNSSINLLINSYWHWNTIQWRL